MSARPLKSALKKSSASRPGPSKSAGHASTSTSTSKAGPSSSGKGKAKHSVTIAKKSQRLKGPDLESGSESNASGFGGESDEDEDVEMGGGDEDDEGLNTDEEIEKSKEGKVKKSTNKRKRPATTASLFGETLTSLLSDPLTTKTQQKKLKPTPESTSAATTTKATTSGGQQPILALSAHKPPTKASVSLEAKAKKQVKVDKLEKEDKARVKDVIEGWAEGGGQEFERGLRKVAQRGVIKLFNAILLASKNAEEATTSLSAQAKLKPDGPKNKKEKDNILGRGGKEDVLTKETFLDMVRKGSTR
ncbi:hypothetical protein CI109_101999 [Kwoniella shandongensis]|uniref:Uncharacterized protein n=1 Tax=Kwoniella shandongensis TaxID=1734106 RepID=A0A5M6BQC9_9TREE|nr:uncharacterized protein CI109_006566 [Kwoniella shandongensis]KAA5525104.1 hypothetical protein CI109_006566 [Kwoniella shandongensis]